MINWVYASSTYFSGLTLISADVFWWRYPFIFFTKIILGFSPCSGSNTCINLFLYFSYCLMINNILFIIIALFQKCLWKVLILCIIIFIYLFMYFFSIQIRRFITNWWLLQLIFLYYLILDWYFKGFNLFILVI